MNRLSRRLQAVAGYKDILTEVAGSSASLYDFSTANGITTALYKFQNSTWEALIDKMPGVENTARTTLQEVGTPLNNFLGDRYRIPSVGTVKERARSGSCSGSGILAVIIPILAGLTQFISVKLSPDEYDNIFTGFGQPDDELHEDDDIHNASDLCCIRFSHFRLVLVFTG